MTNVACEHRQALVRQAEYILQDVVLYATRAGMMLNNEHVPPDEREREAEALLGRASDRAALVVESLQLALASVHCEDCTGAPDPRQLVLPYRILDGEAAS